MRFCTITKSPVRRLAFGLSRELWIVEVGIFLNYLGWGAVLPFEVIYLHDGRGFSLGVAAWSWARHRAGRRRRAVAGAVIDRFGARATARAPAWRSPPATPGWRSRTRRAQAFAAAAVAGTGNGALIPSQSALVASLAAAAAAPPRQRRFARRRQRSGSASAARSAAWSRPRR